jgi:hypothetical protein
MKISEFQRQLLIGSLLLCIFAVISPQTLHSAIFKWKDEKGKTHFTDDRSKIPPQFRKDKPHFSPPTSRPKPKPPNEKKSDWVGSNKSQLSNSGPIETFYAMDKMGRQRPINIDGNTVLFAVATWCHYSKRFINYLNDPSIAAKMSGLDLVFVFQDEWPYIKKNMGKSVTKGEITQVQADERLNQLKQKANWGMVYDPSFMDNLPSEHFFATERFTKLKKIFPKSIPQAYSPSKNNFENSISQWIQNHYKSNKETKEFLVAEYKKYNQGEK